MGKSILGASTLRLIGCGMAIAGCSTEADPARGTPPSGSGQPGSEEPGSTMPSNVESPSLCPACKADEPLPLGGETSEFDGGRAVYRIVSSTPRRLSDPELAPLLQRVEGERELPFRWRESFLESGISGYDESTSVVLSVHVLSASDVQWEPGATPTESVRLDLSVDLHTTDGALRGTILHTLDSPSPYVPVGSNDGLTAVSSVTPLQDFRGSLDLALDPEREVVASLSVELLFSDQGVRGRLSSAVRYQGARTRSVLEGAFPDDGCGFQEWPVPLDAASGGFAAGELRAGFESMAAALNVGPMPAEDFYGSSTQVTLELGTPEHACQYWVDLASVSAPLRVRSRSLDLQQQARIQLSSHRSGAPRPRLLTASPFIAAERLAALTGVQPADFEPVNIGAAAYVAPLVGTSFSETGGFQGVLSLDILDGDRRSGAGILGWCGGDGCE